MTPLMARPARLTLGCILLLSSSLAALPALAKDTPAASTTDSQILDYMADWQGADGQWTDPMTFARIDPAKVKAEAAKRHGKPAATPSAASTGAPAAGTGMNHDVR